MITPCRPSPMLPILGAALFTLLGQGHAVRAEMGRKPAAVQAGGSVAATDTCGRTTAQSLIGNTITPEAKGEIQRSIGHDRIRIIRPGAVISQDLRKDRLNLIVDAAGRLMTTRCG